VTNVVVHGGGSGWVQVDWPDDLTITVYDLGSGFTLEQARLPEDALADSGRGLYIVSQLTRSLEVAARRGGGSAVRTVVAVKRAAARTFDPPRRHTPTLPADEEADAAGTFPREAFLRALVVELAEHLELEHGSDAAEAAVAQVGTDVGARMEDAYRSARAISERLTPEQMGDLYVRLKAAIDGDFYVIEATERRIVLGNRKCPFGEVVKRAPTLCRMTSSVFDGIAARNAGSAAVQLQERIAIGDPECRVVVLLDPEAGDIAPDLHRYAAPPA
jgi:predicted ArsR family transcriptional regulator